MRFAVDDEFRSINWFDSSQTIHGWFDDDLSTNGFIRDDWKTNASAWSSAAFGYAFPLGTITAVSNGIKFNYANSGFSSGSTGNAFGGMFVRVVAGKRYKITIQGDGTGSSINVRPGVAFKGGGTWHPASSTARNTYIYESNATEELFFGVEAQGPMNATDGLQNFTLSLFTVEEIPDPVEIYNGGTGLAASATSVSVTLPSWTVGENDYIFLHHVSSAGGSVTTADPTANGYVKLFSIRNGLGATSGVYYKKAEQSDSGTTRTVTYAAAQMQALQYRIVANTAGPGQFKTTPEIDNTDISTASSVNVPEITPYDATNSWIVSGIGLRKSTAVAQDSADPAGFTDSLRTASTGDATVTNVSIESWYNKTSYTRPTATPLLDWTNAAYYVTWQYELLALESSIGKTAIGFTNSGSSTTNTNSIKLPTWDAGTQGTILLQLTATGVSASPSAPAGYTLVSGVGSNPGLGFEELAVFIYRKSIADSDIESIITTTWSGSGPITSSYIIIRDEEYSALNNVGSNNGLDLGTPATINKPGAWTAPATASTVVYLGSASTQTTGGQPTIYNPPVGPTQFGFDGTSRSGSGNVVAWIASYKETDTSIAAFSATSSGPVAFDSRSIALVPIASSVSKSASDSTALTVTETANADNVIFMQLADSGSSGVTNVGVTLPTWESGLTGVIIAWTGQASGGTSVPTTPTGYTYIGDIIGNTSVRTYAYYKELADSDMSTTFAPVWDGSGATATGVMIVSGESYSEAQLRGGNDASAPFNMRSATAWTAATTPTRVINMGVGRGAADGSAMTVTNPDAGYKHHFGSTTTRTSTNRNLGSWFNDYLETDTAIASYSVEVPQSVSYSTITVALVPVSSSTPIAGSESNSLSFTETAQITVQVSASDSTALTITETASSAGTVSASDSTAITITDTSQPTVQRSVTDTWALSFAETSAVAVSITASDSTVLTITEAQTSSIQLSRTESAALTVTETASSSGTVTASDSTALTVTDTGSVTLNISASDSTALSVAETSNAEISQPVSIVSTTAITASKSVTSRTSGSISVEAGDEIYVPVYAIDQTGLAVTDSQSNSYSLITNTNAYYATAGSTGSLTVTISTTNSTAIAGVVVIVRNGGTPTGTAGTTNTTSPTVTSGSLDSGDAIIGGQGWNGPTTDTYTDDADTSNGTWSADTTSGTSGASAGSNATVRVQTKEVTGTGTQTFNPTLSNARTGFNYVIAIPVLANISKSGSDSGALSLTESAEVTAQFTATDSTALTVTETASSSGTATASDSSALTVTETAAISSSQTVTDSAALTVTESTTSQISVSVTDSAALTVTDTSASQIQASRTDSYIISFAETAAISNSQTVTDTSVLTITDTSAVTVQVSASDSTALTVTEATATSAGITGTDSTALTITDTSAVAITTNISASDATTLTVTDSSQPTVQRSVADSTAITITESTATTAQFSATDSGALTVTETATNAAAAAGADSTPLSLTETASAAITTAVSASDSTALTVTETAAINVQQSVTDSAAITITETAALNVSLSATDSAALTVSETAAPTVQVSVSDSTALSVAETASATITTNVAGSDSTALSISESTTIVVQVSAVDSWTLQIGDFSGGENPVYGAESPAITVTETASVAATASASDSSALSLTETAAPVVQVSGSDSTALSVSETASSAGTVTASDSATLTITESAALSVSLSRTDSTALTITDTSSASVQVSVTDSTALTVTETASSAGTVTASDSAALTISETSDLPTFVSKSASDSAALTVSETAAITVSASVTDSAAITITETASPVVQVSSTDTFIVAFGEDANASVVTQVSASDSTALSVTETAAISVPASVFDSAQISQSETASVAASGTIADSTVISFVESAAITVSVSASDSTALAVSESTQTSALFSATDSTTLSLTEAGSKQDTTQSSGNESTTLSVSETSQITVYVIGNDGTSIAVVEIAAPTASLTSSDAAAIAMAEVSAIGNALYGFESITLIVSDSSDLDVFIIQESEKSFALGADSDKMSGSGTSPGYSVKTSVGPVNSSGTETSMGVAFGSGAEQIIL